MKVTRVETGCQSLYREGDMIRREMRGGYISEGAYGEVVDNMIIVCADVVIVDRSREVLWLAKRSVRPMRGVWWIGGRRNKGEFPVEAMMRNFRRETCLDLPEGRFFPFPSMMEYLWQDREQAPQDKGSHNLCNLFMVKLWPAELSLVAGGLTNREYDSEFGLQSFSRGRLVRDGVHPVILEAYDIIFPPS